MNAKLDIGLNVVWNLKPTVNIISVNSGFSRVESEYAQIMDGITKSGTINMPP